MTVNHDLIALGKRLAQCPMFRWVDGMLAIPPNFIDVDGIRIYWQYSGSIEHPGPMGVHNGGNRWPVSMHGPYVPDLTDPATLGCLLSLVREAWMCPTVWMQWWSGRVWRCRHADGALLGEGSTEAEALVAALEAAEVKA